ncbi:MAG: YbbR-like domain-containing protein [Bacteroidales bacterium]|nr:YbbR-like domain-containing protein [Bacteroidales bacterium]
MVRKKRETEKLHQFSSIVFFVTIAALFWLLIKLSAQYTVTAPLTINMKDAPADLVILDGSQKVKVTLSTTGFELLNYYFKPASRRKVDISLEEVPLHKDSESTYSFSISYAKEKVANFLTIEPNEVSFDDNRIIIKMEQLDSIKVKVIPNLDLSYEKQYNRHGRINIKPDSVTIYGPKTKLASIDNIYTENVSIKNINSNIDINVPLKIDEMINTDNKEVNIKIGVEKYTEAIANVKISNNFNKKLRLFPDKVKIKYIVSLNDYNIIKDNSFIISIDTADISIENNFLPLYLIDYPSNTRITSIEPKEVEYIIIEENEN